MTIEQRYRNPGATHIEAVYTFPLPWGSVLMGVDVELGGESLTGQVSARRQAEQTYEQALSQGDAAILLECNRDGSHTLNLGNLAPGEHCVIRIHYTQSIGIEQGSVRLTLPTVITPRFGDPAKAGLQPQQVPESDMFMEYPFEMTVDVFGTLAAARVSSPSHPVSVGRLLEAKPQGVRISLSRSAWLDRDVVLVLDQLQHESLGQTAEDPFITGQFAVKLALKPQVPSRESPLLIKVLVDCSGSMQGDSIASARLALQAIVHKLQDDDRFSLSRFGDRVLHRARTMWSVTPATRLGAQRWVSQLAADLGGTQMESALASTFDLTASQNAGSLQDRAHPQHPADILLVTDGEIYNVRDTVTLARASGHRVFVVGIGSATNQGLVRKLADATGGACEFVAPGEAVEPAVLRMFNRLRGGRLSKLQMQWPETAEPIWQQELPASVFDGDTVHVNAVFARPVQGLVALTANTLDKSLEAVTSRTMVADVLLERSEPAENHANAVEISSSLARMVASIRIAAMRETADHENSHMSSEATSAISDLAVTYQLVTGETSFVLVHQRAQADKSADMPAQVKVRQMMAAGWAGNGSVTKNDTDEIPSFSRSRVNMDSDVTSPTINVPSVWRASRTTHSVIPPTQMESIPSFLRTTPDNSGIALPFGSLGVPMSFNRPAKPKNPRDIPGHWMSDEVYEGLTPLGLATWLSDNPGTQWPVDLQGLAVIGVGAAVIDWIEIVLEPLLMERGVKEGSVALFVHWMGSEVVLRTLRNTTDGYSANELEDLSMLSLPTAGLEKHVATLMMQALEDLRGSAWPGQLFLLRFGAGARQ